MNQLTVALPFALPPAELAGDLIRVLETPALATLLSRHKRLHSSIYDSTNRALPHEDWLARLATGTTDGVALATSAMQGHGLQEAAQQGHWFMVQPSHLQLARTHLLLADQRNISLSEAEARALFDAARPSFEQQGGTLVYATPQLWFWRADDWASLDTATPDAAVTQNVSEWMPEGELARAGRRLQNEVQMAWHEHPVNQAREARGAAVINACWIWGGAAARAHAAPALAVAGGPDWLQGLTDHTWRSANAEQLLAAPRPLIVPDLIGPAQAGEWSVWLERMQAIDQTWLAPLLQGLRSGQIGQLTLLLSDRERTLQADCSRLALRTFWRKCNLNHLSKQG
ncbi:hypothetical protein GM655_08045 [Pseudoduganella danionis]|uniref:Phosphoglycerate mutase n=1 Tax=Pseudoduganella danionis TaxID=1890295 RepID=A0ABW9SLK3_9BURK|nr:hypothetical protein [Pseudoduganella danionis]